jgi:hypothetical protein
MTMSDKHQDPSIQNEQDQANNPGGGQRQKQNQDQDQANNPNQGGRDKAGQKEMPGQSQSPKGPGSGSDQGDLA